MIEYSVNEIIIEKIDKKEIDKIVKKILKQLLEKERENMLLHYSRFSEDYEKIISTNLIRGKS